MRFVALVLALVTMVAPVSADDCLENMVSLVGWSAKPDQGLTRVGVGLRNVGSMEIRMLRGTVQFVDPFGDPLAESLTLSPDLVLPVGGPGQIDTHYLKGSARLGIVDPAMAKAELCVTGVVLADGSVLRASN